MKLLVLAITPFRSKVVETLKSIVFGYEQSVFYGVKLCSFTMIIIVAGHVNFGLHEVLSYPQPKHSISMLMCMVILRISFIYIRLSIKYN